MTKYNFGNRNYHGYAVIDGEIVRDAYMVRHIPLENGLWQAQVLQSDQFNYLGHDLVYRYARLYGKPQILSAEQEQMYLDDYQDDYDDYQEEE